MLTSSLLAGAALFTAAPSQAADVVPGGSVTLSAEAGKQVPVFTADVPQGAAAVATSTPPASLLAQAATTPPETGSSPSGGYAWLAAAGFVLLVVGSVGRIVGLRILYKNRKNKGL